MDFKASIKLLIKELQRNDIYCTKELEKDLQKLVTTDLKRFIKIFFKDFIRKNFDEYNKFEILQNLTENQKKNLKGNLLRRYEYRDTSNLRCIFVVCNDNNKSVPIILCAFNEDGDKKTGKNSYNKNINRAINIFQKVVEGENEN